MRTHLDFREPYLRIVEIRLPEVGMTEMARWMRARRDYICFSNGAMARPSAKVGEGALQENA